MESDDSVDANERLFRGEEKAEINYGSIDGDCEKDTANPRVEL